MLPGRQPVNHSNLKCDEPGRIIFISINLRAIEQTVDVYQVKVKSERIVFFFYNRINEPPVSQIGIPFVNHLPFMGVQKFGLVHGHHYFGNMTRLMLIFGQSAYHISKPPGFCNRITFC